MGLSAVIDDLINAVRAITPTLDADMPFACAEDGHGGVMSPGDWMQDPQRRLRQFDVRTLSFPRPGPGCNFVAELAVRIAYPMRTDLGLLDRVMVGDVEAIRDQVLEDPSLWSPSADSVWQVDDPAFEIIEDNNGQPATVVLSVPLQIEYRTAD